MAARPPGAERPCAVRRVQGGPQQAARLAAGRIYSARGRKGRGPRERRSLFRGRRAADVEPPYEAHLPAGQEAEVETAVCPDGGFRPGTLLSGVKKADALGFMQESLAEFRRPRTAESGPICFFRRHARQKNTSQAASAVFNLPDQMMRARACRFYRQALGTMLFLTPARPVYFCSSRTPVRVCSTMLSMISRLMPPWT
mgnify:CR=1 FL=1